ncbi:MAG: GNAT family N-acetyltransferase [Nocardioidaceae bacterium]
MLLSRDDQPHHINWLAVATSSRGCGHGAALVRRALDRWPDGDVALETFTADCTEGLPARRLYERLGFVSIGRAAPAPDGSPRDCYVLHR